MTTQTSRLVIEIDSRNAERNARAIANELQNIQRNGDFASRSVDSMSVATRGLAGYMAGLVTVGAAIAKMDTYTGLQNRLKLVTDSQKELNQAMDDTFKIAQNTGSAWDSVAMVYQRFADNADRLGISMSKTAELTETVSKAIAISGGNAASAEAALTQFGQALASGVLRGEEFNSIAEQAPGLLKAIAFGMDVNIGRLRAMAADGKITGDALVAALSKAQPHIDDLFSKTDFTIGNSLTQLSNAVTQFIGEAGKGSGAASLLSESISALAGNLDMVANIAVVGGIALLTKAILTQTVATHGAVAASIQRRASLLAELQAQVSLAASDASRMAAIAQLTVMQLADAKATALRMSGIQRLSYVQSTVIPLELRATQAAAAHTAAIAANTAAQEINNQARARSTMLLGAVGGPIGALTIGVAALAAGYMYMQHRTQQANERLAEQMQWAGKTKEELLALRGVQKEVATNELSDAFDKQNLKLKQLNNEYLGFIDNVVRSSQSNKDAAAIFEQARKGTLSQADALEQLNKFDVLTPQQKKQGLDMVNNTILQTEETLKAKKALSVFGIEAKLGGNAASNMAAEQNSLANASDNAARGVRNAADAVADYNQKLKSRKWDLEFTNNLIQQHGFSAQEAEMRLQAYRENAKQNIKGTTAEQRELIKGIVAQQESADAYKKAQQDAERARNKDSKKAASDAAREEKQRAKEAQRNAEEVAKLKYDLTYKYSSKEVQLQYDLEKEKDEIRKAFSSDSAKVNQYIGWAEKRHKAEKELYEVELGLELYSFKANEVEKLNLWREIESRKINLIQESFKGERDTRRRALNLQYEDELAMIMLAKEERIFQMQQGLMHANARADEYWNLERQRIALSVKDLAERNKQLAIASSLQAEEKRTNLNTAVQQWGGINAELTGTTDQFNLEKERFDRLAASQALFDAELAVAGENHILKEQAYQAHVDRMSMIEGAYQQGSINLQLGYAQDVSGAMAGMFGAMLGESSSAYRMLYAAQQSFALAQAGMNVWKSASDAYANEPGTIWQKAGAAALATIESGAFVTMIQTATPKGFSDGGFTGAGGKFDPAGIVHRGEVVWSQEDIKRWGGVSVVEAMRTSQPPKGYADGGIVSTPKDTYRVGMGTVNAISSNGSSSQKSNYGGDINIEVNVTDSGVSTSGTNTQEQKQLGQMIGNAVRAVIMQEKRQGGLLAK